MNCPLERTGSLEDLYIKLLRLLPHARNQEDIQTKDPSLTLTPPSNIRGLVKVELRSVKFGNAPQYNALSYTWGDPQVTTPILVDGQVKQVTQNLEAALQQLCKGLLEPMIIWVDAVCIDQDNDVEKTAQVQHMRDIYSRAESVIAWLGSVGQTGSAEMAIQFVKDFGHEAHTYGIGETPDKHLHKLLSQAETRNQTAPIDEIDDGDLYAFVDRVRTALMADSNPCYDQLIKSLQNFLGRPYWSRIWVVQEVAVASQIVFQCGDHLISLKELHHALRVLRNFRYWQSSRPKRRPTCQSQSASQDRVELNERLIQTNPSKPIELLRIRKESGTNTLIYLLRRLRLFHASDPRDHAFALLGLAKDTGALGLRVDYSKSTQQVFTEFSRALLRVGCYDILSYSSFSTGARLDDLPTWAFDWSVRPQSVPLQQRAVDRSVKPATSTVLQPSFSACAGMPSQRNLENSQHDDWDMSLDLLSIHIGTVSHVEERNQKDTMESWFTSIQTLRLSHEHIQHSEREKRHAFWRTTVADQGFREFLVKPRLTNDTVEQLDKVFAAPNETVISMEALEREGFGDYAREAQTIAKGRRAFLTSNGSLAIGPQSVQTGDIVVVVLGADVPFLLRPRKGVLGYYFIGEAYIHGFMDGEAARGSGVPELISIY